MSYLDEIQVGGTDYDIYAKALSGGAAIDGVDFDATGNVTHYAVCATAAGTAAKTATLGTNFTLSAGSKVEIKFTYGNTTASPTLNINSTGDKAIKAYGTTAAGSGAWVAGQIVQFEYDGTNWLIVGRVPVDTTLTESGQAADAAVVGNLFNRTMVVRSNISENDDLDDYIDESGMYYCSASILDSISNSPFTSGSFVLFVKAGNSADAATGQVQYATGRYGQFAYRYRYSGTWTAWHYAATSDDVATINGNVEDVSNAALIHRGTLTSSDDVDTVIPPGQWYVSSGSLPTNWPFGTAGRLLSFGSTAASLSGKDQLALSTSGAACWRAYRSGAWNEWAWLSGGPAKGYVAIGASTTLGGTGGYGTADQTYPELIGQLGNFKVTNLAHGSTGFVRRYNGDNSMDSYMDVITDPDNAAALSAADLITIWVSVNDSVVSIPLGEADDYYAFTAGEATTDLYANCTVAGAMNFIVKYISENFPQAQLMFVIGPRSVRYFPTAMISNGKIVYTPSSNQWSQQVGAMAKTICAAANVPVADSSDSYGTVWNAADKFVSDSNKHPTLTGYDQYNHVIASAVIAKYHN